MRQFFTLLLLFSCFTVFSQDDARHRHDDYPNYGAAVISVNGYPNQSFSVFIDGREYEADQNNEVYITRVGLGSHVLRIVRQGGVYNSHLPKQLYYSRIFVRSKSQLDFVINRNGKVFKDEFPLSYNNYDYNPNPGGYNRPDYMQPMDAGDFENFKRTLQAQGFDSERLMIVKQVMGMSYFKVNQVREIMRLFSFDETKLEIAKLAYSRTVDRENYYGVNEELTYSSSKEDLNRYLMSYKD